MHTNEIQVLDHGYVRLITYTPHSMVDLEAAIEAGDLALARKLIRDHDLTEVNAARASFGKASAELTDRDKGLINFLGASTPKHTSPFRHAHVTLEVNAPLPVARQWWRHVIGAGTTEEGTPWSELSRRYVRGGIQYHTPEVWRSKPANSKQGSGDPVDQQAQDRAHAAFVSACDKSVGVYDFLINELGIAPEQARMCLPQGVFTSWQWSPSIQALTNFLDHRLRADAQHEIRLYGQAVLDLTNRIYPLGIETLL